MIEFEISDIILDLSKHLLVFKTYFKPFQVKQLVVKPQIYIETKVSDYISLLTQDFRVYGPNIVIF